MNKKKMFIIIGITFGVILLGLGIVFGIFYSNMVEQTNNTNPTYWEDDIRAIEDRYDTVPDTDIVFIGSSSIRKWESLSEDFEEYIVVNHGFGGSKIADSTYYYDRLVTPFNPELIVVFSGTNNINQMIKEPQTANEVYNDFLAFYEKSQLENPEVPVVYISITPTQSRWEVWDIANEVNTLIETYSETQDNLYFVDAVDEFLINGEPNEELFQFDKLHLTEEGYEIWAEIIKTVVDSILD